MRRHLLIGLWIFLMFLAGPSLRADVNVFVPGDVNGDGTFDVSDVDLVFRAFLSGDTSILAHPDRADVEPRPSRDPRGYGDGVIRAEDVNLFFRVLIGVDSFPIPADPINEQWIGLTHPPQTPALWGQLVVARDDTIYLSSFGGGVSVSRDHGQHWTAINQGLPSLDVNALAVNALGEPIAGVGFKPAIGAFRYTGGRWQQATGISATFRISAFTLDQAGNVLAVTGWAGDVFRSTDNGSSYTRIAAGVGNGTGALWAVCKAPDGTLYVGGESHDAGIYRSTDGGFTWQPFGLSYADGYKGNVFSIAMSAAGDLLVGGRQFGTSGPLQRYSGGVWKPVVGLPPFSLLWSIVMNGSGHLFANSGQAIYRSTDNGQTWLLYGTGLPGINSLGTNGLGTDSMGHLYVLLGSGEPLVISGAYMTAAIP